MITSVVILSIILSITITAIFPPLISQHRYLNNELRNTQEYFHEQAATERTLVSIQENEIFPLSESAVYTYEDLEKSVTVTSIGIQEDIQEIKIESGKLSRRFSLSSSGGIEWIYQEEGSE